MYFLQKSKNSIFYQEKYDSLKKRKTFIKNNIFYKSTLFKNIIFSKRQLKINTPSTKMVAIISPMTYIPTESIFLITENNYRYFMTPKKFIIKKITFDTLKKLLKLNSAQDIALKKQIKYKEFFKSIKYIKSLKV